MLKFSKIISSKSKNNIVKQNSGYLGIFHLLKMNVSKLINYSTDMCLNGQGTYYMVLVFSLGETQHQLHWYRGKS
jgi:hypothetical protein